MSFLRHLRSTPVKLCAVVVGASLLMGQGCPPTDGGGGTPEPTQRQFVGATDCRICHSRVYDTWSQTAHAGALETLKAIGQDQNTNCIGCHVVGYGQDGGFTSEEETPQLAGVQCENCHGAGLDHRSNVNVASLRPSTSIAATVCGNCHNGFHHPTYDEWHSTNHSRVEPDVAASLTQGRSANSCGVCHSGDYRKERFINGNTSVPDTLLAGVAPDEMNAVTCAICHDPHMQTGNDAIPEAGHDKQLRYPEVSTPDQANTVAAVMDTTRFNLCGQCHHDRGRVWTDTSRGTHPSNQVNMYLGEMPVPDGITLLLPNERTVHRFVPKQCVTCHMVHTDAFGEEQPAHTGHGLDIDFTGCSTSGCHPTASSAQDDMESLETYVDSQLESLKARMGDISTWGYSSEGGPAADQQAAIPDVIKKVRFLVTYIESDGSKGVHNPEYVRSMLHEADDLLLSIDK